MNRLGLLAASLSLTALTACSTATEGRPPATYASQPQSKAALHALFKESDEGSLRRNPLNALFRGDMRYADRLGDYITDAYYDAERAVARAELARLEAIDRESLSATDRIAYDVFRWQTESTLKGLSPEILPLTAVRPIDHFNGFQTFYPDIASGESAAPFKTVQDYENNIKRHRDFAAYIDRAIVRFREGLAAGVTQPKLVVRNVIDQLDYQLKQPVADSPFYAPLEDFPDGISAAEEARLTRETVAAIRNDIFPAYARLHDFLRDDYLPQAREGVGLVHMPGGDRLYAALIEQNTTLPLSADHVHALGLSEVARIRSEMEAVKARVGFSGTLAQFFEHLRTDPQFQPPSREWLRDRYYEIGKTVDARVPQLFATLPKTPLEIRPVPEYREQTDAAGSYSQGTPDGSRPGIFYYNAYDLPSRSTWGMETLYLHEAAPGHHFQISLAQENEALPNFMRFGGNTAYVEGWALYAETLWDELGLETDPYQRFGGLNDEMLRAMRLVVDSGIHAKGWTRDQAIQYMLDNSPMGRTDATIEVERYIAIPGQALSYKIGQLKILELRAKAERELGGRFDLKDFHAQILDTGALPLSVLEAKIDRWIAEKRG